MRRSVSRVLIIELRAIGQVMRFYTKATFVYSSSYFTSAGCVRGDLEMCTFFVTTRETTERFALRPGRSAQGPERKVCVYRLLWQEKITTSVVVSRRKSLYYLCNVAEVIQI